MFNSISQAYFSGLEDGNFAAVPWSADAVLHTPLAPSPIAGRDAIEAFFRPLAGQLGSIALLAVYPNAAGDSWVAEARVGPLHVMDKFV